MSRNLDAKKELSRVVDIELGSFAVAVNCPPKKTATPVSVRTAREEMISFVFKGLPGLFFFYNIEGKERVALSDADLFDIGGGENADAA